MQYHNQQAAKRSWEILFGFFRYLAVFALLGLMAGCSNSPALLDQEEENHPLLQKAKARYRAQDVEGAVKLYTEALDQKATLARAHLELAIIYDQNLEQFVRAIYHYQRYLELRPKTEKKSLIEDAIRHARMSYAASLPDRPSDAIREIADLQVKIKQLEAENEQLGQLLRASGREPVRTAGRASAGVNPPVSPPVTPVAAPAAGPAEYKVKKGDNLSKISVKMYGTESKWKDILEANRSTLRNERSLRPGQTLKIPR